MVHCKALEDLNVHQLFVEIKKGFYGLAILDITLMDKTGKIMNNLIGVPS